MALSERGIPFRTIDWTRIPRTEHKGETGTAFWQTVESGGLRIRIVEYSAGYLADHWCKKGHIVHCLEGDFVSELQDGGEFSEQRNDVCRFGWSEFTPIKVEERRASDDY